MSISQNSAYLIKVNDRFFYSFGKNKRIQTAWCLSGAKFYHDFNEVHQDYSFIKIKYPNAEITCVSV